MGLCHWTSTSLGDKHHPIFAFVWGISETTLGYSSLSFVKRVFNTFFSSLWSQNSRHAAKTPERCFEFSLILLNRCVNIMLKNIILLIVWKWKSCMPEQERSILGPIYRMISPFNGCRCKKWMANGYTQKAKKNYTWKNASAYCYQLHPLEQN